LFEENQNTDDKGLDSATDQMKKDFYFNNGNDSISINFNNSPFDSDITRKDDKKYLT
jgi:hypothetical protein